MKINSNNKKYFLTNMYEKLTENIDLSNQTKEFRFLQSKQEKTFLRKQQERVILLH